jgi:hypothetical protein
MLYGVGAARPSSKHISKPTGILLGAKWATEPLEVSLFMAVGKLFRELGDVDSSRSKGKVLCL